MRRHAVEQLAQRRAVLRAKRAVAESQLQLVGDAELAEIAQTGSVDRIFGARVAVGESHLVRRADSRVKLVACTCAVQVHDAFGFPSDQFRDAPARAEARERRSEERRVGKEWRSAG